MRKLSDLLLADDYQELRYIAKANPRYPTLDLSVDTQMAKLLALDLIFKRRGRWELTTEGRAMLAPPPPSDQSGGTAE